MQKYIVEAMGTGSLALLVGLSLAGTFPVATPVLAALTLGFFVYTVGHVSGVHINPAVTIGVWSIGKISSAEAGRYIIAQFLGALGAMMVLQVFPTQAEPLLISTALITGVAEMVGTFFFTFGIASVVYGKTPNGLSGAMVGGSLLLGIAFAAYLGSNGVLNPAVALGIGSFGVMYIIPPIIGSVIGMRVYAALR